MNPRARDEDDGDYRVEQRGRRRDARREQLREDMREAAKEAIREWLDDQFTKFGKWTLAAFAALVMAALGYIVLASHGWRPPPAP